MDVDSQDTEATDQEHPLTETQWINCELASLVRRAFRDDSKDSRGSLEDASDFQLLRRITRSME
jgi:hypothetical protein